MISEHSCQHPLRARRFMIGFLISIPCMVASISIASAQISERDEEIIDNIVTQMTLEELIGQTLVLGYHAQVREDLPARSNAALESMIRDYRPGAIILFGHNFPERQDEESQRRAIWEVTNSFQREAHNSQPEARKVPLLIAADQEGGGKMELKHGITRTPDPMYIGASRSPDNAFTAGRIIGSEMKRLGINTILAPVADINNNDRRDIVGKRSFGAHKDLVAPLAVCFMHGLQSSRVLSIGKHYPGHGDAEEDPHHEMAKVEYQTTDRLRNWDIHPFKKLIAHGVNGVMTAHLIVPPLDNKPITISEKAIKQELRRSEPSFEGIVMSDDISSMMGIIYHIGPADRLTGDALNEHTNRQRFEVIRRAIEAGTDMVMMAWIEGQDSDLYPERTVTLDEFDGIYERLIEYFSAEEKKALLRKATRRILRQKATLVSAEDFQERTAWQPALDERVFRQLRKKHEEEAKKITREAVILISERGRFVNNLHDSNLFSAIDDESMRYGPLSVGRLLQTREDRLLIVSPVFKNDVLTRYIVGHQDLWFPQTNIDTELLIYGWKEIGGGGSHRLPGAEQYWNLPIVKRYFYKRGNGSKKFLDENIEEKAIELADRSRAASGVIFGLVTGAHVRILEAFLEEVQDVDVVVLLQKEPYFLPSHIYSNRKVSVLFTPSLPDEELAVDALFGRVKPRSVQNLPFNIPGQLDIARSEVDLTSAEKCAFKSYEEYLSAGWGKYREAKRLVHKEEDRKAKEMLNNARQVADKALRVANEEGDHMDQARQLLGKIDELTLELMPIVH